MQNRNYAIRVYSELLSYAAYVGVGIKAYMPSFNYNEIFYARTTRNNQRFYSS